MKHSFVFFALLLTVVLAGCDTFDRRAREKAATFAALAPGQREKLKHGVIEIGNSPDMVFIALGQPDEKHEKTTAHGREITWIYNSYHEEYEGSLHLGTRRHLFYDPARKRYDIILEPIYRDVYSEQVEENIRIDFRDDKVAQIEQPKP